MQLTCKISINNRTVPLKEANSRKPVNATVMLCKHPKNQEPIIIIYSTHHKNGDRYLLKNNLKRIVVRFINEGKVTIQFENPPHDMFLRGDTSELKNFLQLLKRAMQGELGRNELRLSTVAATPKNLPKPKSKKLTIDDTCRSVLLEPFPDNLEKLYINSVKLCSFDNRILKLNRLNVLDLSDNLITRLPTCLNTLALRELNVSSNDLIKSNNAKDWEWMSGKLAKTLMLLNLGNNRLEALPNQVARLKKLVTLDVRKNDLKYLPSGIGRLSDLKVLICIDNSLTRIPASIQNLRLRRLEISYNSNRYNFEQPLVNPLSGIHHSPGSLRDIAANTVLTHRLFYDATTIPRTLVDYLDFADYCICGRATFSSHLKIAIPFLVSSITEEINRDVDFDSYVTMECHCCSLRCYQVCKSRCRRRFVR